MKEDKFEKRIKELVHFTESGRIWIDRNAVLDEYIAFKAEKPTAPVSLVEDIKAYANNDASYATWRQDIEKILSSYTPVPDEKPTAPASLLSLIGDLSTALEYHDPNNALIDKADEAIKNAYTPVPDEKPTEGLVEELWEMRRALKGAEDFTRNDGPFKNLEAKGHREGCLECYEEIGKYMEEILSRHAAPSQEPKDCGYTLATCPYERCSGITIRKEEPLAVLADRKGYAVYTNKRKIKPISHMPWHISLTFIKSTNKRTSFYAGTYAAAEAKALAYLEGLDDVKGEAK